ncbi:tetratricopeptide repeat protein [Flavobacterium olei]|uniref:tetratricopeptide repeat protein n=1 Tax=Flavobacterium olei TaxID=1886782 RepID=UPI00321BA2CD
MKRKNFLICLIYFLAYIGYGQIPPLPPPPPKQTKSSKDKIYGDYSSDNNKKDKSKQKTKIVEVTTYNEPVVDKKIFVSDFKVSLEEFYNVNSNFYYKKVEDLLSKLDTTLISDEQIISLTKYKIHANAINPSNLDSLARKAYKLNEEKKYDEALIITKQILYQSPNNITGHKESSYAYKHLGNTELSNAHFKMMVKLINSVMKYGEGIRSSPYILNNFFEGVSIYEAKFGLYPQRTRLILTKEKVLLAGYDSYHIMRFANLTHWFPMLKEEDYKVELD